MSDKFFFKGRQDARQSTLRFGYERNANRIAGSKKYPLNLIVTSAEREQEILAILNDANLFANIQIDTREGGVESIEPLTFALTKGTTIKTNKVPARNDLCSCGSGKKYKKCCA